MSVRMGPSNLTTNGLVFMADASNPRSGIGDSDWRDLVTSNAATEYVNATYVAAGTRSYYDFQTTTSRVTFFNSAAVTNAFDGGGTISGWVYAETAGGGNLSRWFAKDQSTSGGWIGFIETGTGGTVSLAFFRSFESNFGWWRVSNAMSVNAWHNIVITYNSNSTANVPTFYLDGVQLATPTTVFSASGRVTDDSPNSLYVGNNNLNTRNWDGRIGVVQLYNRILTAVEINNNFKALRHRYGV